MRQSTYFEPLGSKIGRGVKVLLSKNKVGIKKGEVGKEWNGKEENEFAFSLICGGKRGE